MDSMEPEILQEVKTRSKLGATLGSSGRKGLMLQKQSLSSLITSCRSGQHSALPKSKAGFVTSNNVVLLKLFPQQPKMAAQQRGVSSSAGGLRLRLGLGLDVGPCADTSTNGMKHAIDKAIIIVILMYVFPLILSDFACV